MTKKELRSYIKSIIPSNPEKIKTESVRICNKILQCHQYLSAPLVLCYMAMDDEVNLEKVMIDAISRKKSIGLPRIMTQSGLMNFYYVDAQTPLKAEDTYGIREPEAKEENLISPDSLPDGTLILVPGRAFTKDGCRLGRGKGFYDRWLSKIPLDKKNRLHLAGVCFPQQIVESIPCDEDDIMMNSVFY